MTTPLTLPLLLFANTIPLFPLQFEHASHVTMSVSKLVRPSYEIS